MQKYGIGLGLYYSLWDRKVNPDVDDQSKDAAYNSYMIAQLKELVDKVKPYTPIVEFWFDGGWTKQNYRWPVMDIYQTIKSQEPDCQIGINWSIGSPENVDAHPVLPEQQKQDSLFVISPVISVWVTRICQPIMILRLSLTMVKITTCHGNPQYVSVSDGSTIQRTISLSL